MAVSSARSTVDTRFRRHRSEQNRIASQLRAHFARHSMMRPQLAHQRGSGAGVAERPIGGQARRDC